MQKLSNLANKWETSELRLQQEGLQQEGSIKLEMCMFYKHQVLIPHGNSAPWSNRQGHVLALSARPNKFKKEWNGTWDKV